MQGTENFFLECLNKSMALPEVSSIEVIDYYGYASCLSHFWLKFQWPQQVKLGNIVLKDSQQEMYSLPFCFTFLSHKI